MHPCKFYAKISSVGFSSVFAAEKCTFEKMYYTGLVVVAVYPVIDYTRTRPSGTGVPDDRVLWKKQNFSKKIWRIKNNVYLCNPKQKRRHCRKFLEKIWEHSSAGLEHLPYKQGVTGSNPVAPTTNSQIVFHSVF